MRFEKPFYSLHIQSQYCGFVVCVNGCYVEFHKDTTPLTIEYPVNQWVKNGDNTIEIFFRNALNQQLKKKMIQSEATIICTLYVKEYGSEEKTALSTIAFNGETLPRTDEFRVDYNQITSVEKLCLGTTPAGTYTIERGQGLKPDPVGECVVNDITFGKGVNKSLYLQQGITLLLPIPKWEFFEGETQRRHSELSDDEWNEARKEMLVEYQKIWDVIDSGNFDDLEPLIGDRCAEYDLALYEEPGETLRSLIEGLKRNTADPEWPLRPTSLETCDLCVAFNQQLVWLHGWDRPMSGDICLSHTKSDLAKKYLFIYAKINGKWKVVR